MSDFVVDTSGLRCASCSCKNINDAERDDRRCVDPCGPGTWDPILRDTGQEFVQLNLTKVSYDFIRDNIGMMLDMLWEAKDTPQTTEEVDRQIEDLKVMREIIEKFELDRSRWP
jgi:hypothetical protein